MTEKEMKRLSRADLLEMLIRQSTELEDTKKKLAEAEAALEKRDIMIDKAGSIAEASLQLNGIFEAAQAACQQYTENIRLLSQRQETACARMERESRETAERLVVEAQRKAEDMDRETKVQCAEMLERARVESQSYWNEVSQKLKAFYEEHAGLQELLARFPGAKM